MSLAKHTLEQLSQDPEACDLAREREDAIKLYKDELAVTRAKAEISGLRKGRKEGRDQGRKEGRDQGRKEGRDQGRKEGRVEILLEQLSLRFGRLSSAARTHVLAASAEQIDAWARQVLTARSLDEILSR